MSSQIIVPSGPRARGKSTIAIIWSTIMDTRVSPLLFIARYRQLPALIS